MLSTTRRRSCATDSLRPTPSSDGPTIAGEAHARIRIPHGTTRSWPIRARRSARGRARHRRQRRRALRESPSPTTRNGSSAPRVALSVGRVHRGRRSREQRRTARPRTSLPRADVRRVPAIMRCGRTFERTSVPASEACFALRSPSDVNRKSESHAARRGCAPSADGVSWERGQRACARDSARASGSNRKNAFEFRVQHHRQRKVAREEAHGKAQHQRQGPRRAGGGRHAAAVGHPRAGRPDRHQVRLRRRAVRRLLGAHQRRGAALVLDSRRRVKATDRIVTIEGLSANSSHPVQKAWVALDVPQCGYCQSGQIMAAAALLSEESEPDRQGHRRGDDQHLPLRHLSAHSRGRAHGGGSGKDGRPGADQPSRRPRGDRDEKDDAAARNRARRIFRAASSSSAPRRAGGGLALGIPASVRRRIGARRQAREPRPARRRGQRLGRDQARRHLRASASRARRWGRARSPASRSSSPKSSSATGRRSRPNRPTPGQNLARKRVWGEMGTGGSRGIRTSEDYVRRGGAAARIMLLQAAADEWKVPVGELTVSDGVITHAATKRTTTYGKVAAAAAKLAAARSEEHQAQGSEGLEDRRQADEAARHRRQAQRQPGLRDRRQAARHAVRRDQGLPGVRRQARQLTTRRRSPAGPACARAVKVNDTTVAVVADTWWHAKTALDALPIVWDEGPGATQSSATIADAAEGRPDRRRRLRVRATKATRARRSTARRRKSRRSTARRSSRTRRWSR